MTGPWGLVCRAVRVRTRDSGFWGFGASKCSELIETLVLPQGSLCPNTGAGVLLVILLQALGYVFDY